ncbi:MAG: hypothetical protein NC097_01865 [Clostridium sp.]|nr:ABC transporter permease [Prevotella sp.]MCM1428525.1 hypothetical protein [Clostridium sp.]
MSANLITRLLRRNLSGTQIAGFILSNFIGLAIVIAGLQFYLDVRSLWDSEDSFIRKDYLVVNKKITASNTLGTSSSRFSEEEISDLESQPWVRSVGRFTSPSYRVSASVSQGGRALSTDMFFESIPSDYVDTGDSAWRYKQGDTEVPIIISKDYLTLYNFGFAATAGLPQLSEQMMSSVPMDLYLSSEDGSRRMGVQGRIVGYSNRLNTILVPKEFLDYTNEMLAGIAPAESEKSPRRLIIDVSSPGDVAIRKYLDNHSLELAGDKSNSQASYLLNIVVGVMLGVGIVITVLSFFILMLSISLLMQKNRDKLHSLIMLGVDLRRVGNPYCHLIMIVSMLSWLMGVGAMLLFRSFYVGGLSGISGARTADVWLPLGVGLGIALLTIVFNIISVRRKVRASFF